LAVARNTGIRNAQSKYFTFLDGDDFWGKENLELKIAVLETDSSIGGVFSDFVLFNDREVISYNGVMMQYPIFKRTGWSWRDIFSENDVLRSNNREAINIYKGNIFTALLFGNFINACSIIVKKEFQEKIGNFRPELRTQQDYEYWLRFSQKYLIAYVDLPLVFYRRHHRQLTDHKNIARIIRTVSEILKPYYAKRHAIFQDSVRRDFEQRYGQVFKNLGKAYLGKKENRNARFAFLKSFKIDRSNKISILYWIFSFFPPLITRDTVLHVKSRKFS
jgi:glycosyltransferase involved in cell wall biosynthesis